MLRWTLTMLCLAALAVGCKTTPWNETPPGDTAAQQSSGGDPANAFSSQPAPAAASAGAAAESRTSGSAGASTRLTDVPVPEKATADMERTYVYEASGIQVGRMVYRVKGGVTETAQFYIDECKALGWNLESVLQANTTNLLFRKPGRRLDVSVQPQSLRSGNLLILTLTPEGGSGLK
jgi:hypothetical protein